MAPRVPRGGLADELPGVCQAAPRAAQGRLLVHPSSGCVPALGVAGHVWAGARCAKHPAGEKTDGRTAASPLVPRVVEVEQTGVCYEVSGPRRSRRGHRCRLRVAEDSLVSLRRQDSMSILLRPVPDGCSVSERARGGARRCEPQPRHSRWTGLGRRGPVCGLRRSHSHLPRGRAGCQLRQSAVHGVFEPPPCSASLPAAGVSVVGGCLECALPATYGTRVRLGRPCLR
mmetsp:Transcript_7057/g.21424  ORF Transcript_7057/g.21424 Transcript_7057/m.21424 type:complete len:229 (-) Transcript_7057:21-707(-)